MTHEGSIKTRLDCVQELVSSPELFDGIEEILNKLENLNITSIVTSFLYNCKRSNPAEDGEKKIDLIMRLKNIIEAVDPVRKLLYKSGNYLFQSYSKHLEDDGFRQISNLINTFIKADCRYAKNNYKTYLKYDLFKDKTIVQIDLIIKLLKTDFAKIRALVIELNEKHGLPINYRYNNTRKFYFILSLDELKKSKENAFLPKEFYNIKQANKILQFTCEELDRLNLNYDRCLNTFFLNCNQVLKQPFDEIGNHIICLYKFIDIIAMLDLLQSFAKVSALNDWKKPTFGKNLLLTKCTHPFYQLRGIKSTANSFQQSVYSNIAIVTGPNNSGKTTFIKQVAICQLLAQIGCFVPCEASSFRIMDRLFAR